MITVLIAGGSGTRLWPLSTPDYPKHLLKVNGDASLLQAAYRRGKMLGEHVYVVTEKSHAHLVREQLPELSDDAFIVEPGRRNTASCVIAGLHHLSSRHDADEPIAFLAADHFIRDVEGFAASFRRAAKASAALSREVLVGIEPTYPSTGLGYIKKGAAVDGFDLVYEVEAFKEKPELPVAQEFFRSGRYLWNGCYFIGSLNTFLATMERCAPELKQRYDSLRAARTKAEYDITYLGFENVPIDTALNEKVDNLLVVSATFDWMDLGSFNDLHAASDNDEQGNHYFGQGIDAIDIENTYVRNEEAKPVVVIGLDNVVVVNTPAGILVARKDLSQRVGEAAKRIIAASPLAPDAEEQR